MRMAPTIYEMIEQHSFSPIVPGRPRDALSRLIEDCPAPEPLDVPAAMRASKYHRDVMAHADKSEMFFTKFKIDNESDTDRWWIDCQTGEIARKMYAWERSTLEDGFKVVSAEEAFLAVGAHRRKPIGS